jgi:hypothetical protein
LSIFVAYYLLIVALMQISNFFFNEICFWLYFCCPVVLRKFFTAF